mmetsp:Transcript_62034/g.171557  ORF Transcript_62034/g.171557 Transcript_62034/m.171557 type:complete len:247 (-) Transcript_62034:77-817(-)
MSRCGAAIAAILLAAARAQACEGEACDASALLQLGRGGEASLGHYSPAGQPCWSDGECFGDQPQGGPGTWVCGRYSANENYWQCCLIEYSEEHDGEMWCASPEGTACSEGLDLNCKSPLKCQPNVASSSGDDDHAQLVHLRGDQQGVRGGRVLPRHRAHGVEELPLPDVVEHLEVRAAVRRVRGHLPPLLGQPVLPAGRRHRRQDVQLPHRRPGVRQVRLPVLPSLSREVVDARGWTRRWAQHEVQ